MQNDGLTWYNGTMSDILSVLLAIVLLLVAALLLNVITAVIVYAAWNWGAVPALTFAKPIGLWAAYWLGLLPSGIVVSIRKDD